MMEEGNIVYPATVDKEFAIEISKEEDCKEIWNCIQCGICTGACPLSPLRSQNPRKIVAMIREGLKNNVLGAVDPCFLCGQCQMLCPKGVKLKEVLLKLRELNFKSGKVCEGLQFVNELLSSQFNPYMQPPEMRTQWLEATGISSAFKDQSKVVYFAGCTASYMDVSQEIPRTIVKLLTRLNEDWTLLNEERCCGMPFLYIGNVDMAREFALHNVKEIEKKGAEIVITGCPTCWHTLKFRYPKLLKNELKFNVVHITEYVADKLTKGHVAISKKISERVTYHDPCDLARYSMINIPREILKRITYDFVEMPLHGKDTLCCGGGGLMEAVDSKLRSNITMRRIKQAENVGAKILATSCGGCKYYLSQAAAETKSGIQVKDITELLYSCL
ncbi:MAG: (Fe-S)-binding protein [Candidatus Bathyarchaeia archaeon]